MGSKLGWWRIGCSTLVGLSVLTVMAYRGRQPDLELYRNLTARRESLQILNHIKDIQVELMGNRWDEKVQSMNHIRGYPSPGLWPATSRQIFICHLFLPVRAVPDPPGLSQP